MNSVPHIAGELFDRARAANVAALLLQLIQAAELEAVSRRARPAAHS